MSLNRSVAGALAAISLLGCTSVTSPPSPAPQSAAATVAASQTPAAAQATASTPAVGTPSATVTAPETPVPPTIAPTPVATDVASPTPTATPTETSGSSGQTNGLIVKWEPVDNPGLGVVYGFTAVASATGTMVVIGEATQDLSTAVWSSTDGRTWTSADFPDALIGSVDPTAVAAAGPGFVIVGQDFDTSAGLVYVSVDGRSWERIDSPVLAGQPLRLVAGVSSAVTAFSEGNQAFTSSDARTWQAASDPSASTVATGLMALKGDGTTLWAVRQDADQPQTSQQLLQVWQSTDAQSWTQAATLDGSQGAVQAWVAGGPTGVVVIANVYRHNTSGWLAWYSPDGTTWQTVTNNPTNVTDVIATEAGFVAVGHYNLVGGCALDESQDLGVTWTSADGILWRQMPEKGWKAREIHVVAQYGNDLIGLGVDFNVFFDNGDSGIEWVFPLPISADDQAVAPSPTPEPTPAQGCGP